MNQLARDRFAAPDESDDFDESDQHDVQSDSVNSVQERVESDSDDSHADSRPVSRQNDSSSVSSNSAEHVNLEPMISRHGK